MNPATEPLDQHAGPHFTIRHMLLTVAYATLAIIARKTLAGVSITWSWVAFGAILFGGITAVSADAGSAIHTVRWRTVPRILFMLGAGGLFGFLMSRT